MTTLPTLPELGSRAPEFALPDLHGRTVRLDDVRGEHGTLIMFICNHCPYVRAIADRIVEDSRALLAEGIGVVAIMSNDYRAYPADAPDRMRAFAAEHRFPFPYLLDETQMVARAYEAVCTPDFFGYDADLALRYRGRLDASRTTPVPDARRELLEAMRRIAATGEGPEEQVPSMGCSIKWRAA
ncbi:thioredoxin family protein [Thalassobaculum fulvum]|uniref:Thioredoxin family protein n=1 Tax=Thalassobaculum fulvum TaxID=1633335 RepID=A0A918XPU6_9PROT|nr:thioredoxin family protein [Thalassobaculum fulvum]GHD43166.1 thioredoxin family protein [Thalassobaculum fulvum]